MIETDKARRAASYKARGKSVMFSAVYNDGRTSYFVIEGVTAPVTRTISPCGSPESTSEPGSY